MDEATVTRWRRYGHDRLYVTTPSGDQLGWYDLRTEQPHPATPDVQDALAAAVASWRGSAADGDGESSWGPATTTGSAGPPPPIPASQPAAPAPAPEPEPPAPAPVEAPEPPAPSRLIDPEGPAELPPAGTDEPHAAQSADLAEQTAWADLADRQAGAMARQQAIALKEAAPVRTFLGRMVGARTEERAWRIGAVGEEKVADQFGKVSRHDPRWRFLHAVPVGERGSDIDHVAIGPAGVFTVNAKHHPGAKIWVAGNAFLVNGQRQPYIRNSRHEATRAGRLLSEACGFPVAARGLIVPVRADDVTVKETPDGVDVVPRYQLARWLRRLPHILDEPTIEAIYAQARRSTTWMP